MTTSRRQRSRLARSLIAATALASGCATWNPPADTSDAPLRARAISLTEDGVTVSAAVLSRADAVRMFGADVYEMGVQPVWIEVHNNSQQPLWLLRSGTDPDYFSPLEVAWSAHVSFDAKTNARIDEHFDRLALRGAVPAGRSSSGVLFTNPQPVTKLLNVDLLGDRTLVPFTLFLKVPDGIGVSFEEQINQYAPDEITRCDDEASLRRAIAALPCCGQPEGSGAPEPVNLVVIGTLADLGAAAVRRGYRRDVEPETAGQRLFGSAPSFVLRKHAQAGSSATWLRVWRAPIEYRGQYVFVLQAGRPVGGRFAPPGEAQALHADVDEARNIVIQDLLYSGGVIGLAFEKSPEVPAAFHTDGLRGVLFFGTRPLTFSDVELLHWDGPYD